MPAQDLTPQLRTRLSRVERVVGVFVMIATLLLLAGFAYYVYTAGARKGWWVRKYPYYTFTDSGTGLRVGDVVKLLGFEVGKITGVTALSPQDILYSDYGNVYIQFVVNDPFQGYIWTDSKVKVTASDFLGNRVLELMTGGSSFKTNAEAKVFATYKVENGELIGVYSDKKGDYEPLSVNQNKGYWLPRIESPAVTERLEQMANMAQTALPAILDMTNRLNLVLSNVIGVTTEAQAVLAGTRPILSNATVITANLSDPKGSLGDWIIPTNMVAQIGTLMTNASITLTSVNRTVSNTDSNVTMLALSLDQTLVSLASLTSNLNDQVESNTNLVKSLSDLIVNANDMVQGLKRHWLLRSAFKGNEESEPPPARPRRTPPPKIGK